jgi:hypothetical protein
MTSPSQPTSPSVDAEIEKTCRRFIESAVLWIPDEGTLGRNGLDATKTIDLICKRLVAALSAPRVEPVASSACDICGRDTPHSHETKEVELERYARPPSRCRERDVSELDIERAAAVLAALLPDAVSIHFNGEACTARFPQDYGPHEQAAFRLVARTMLQAAAVS